jgi:hypothetical protein
MELIAERQSRSIIYIPPFLGRMSMVKLKPDSIETHLLHLPADERARLAELLLASLDTADSDSTDPSNQPELDAAWALEADRRYGPPEWSGRRDSSGRSLR